MESLRFPIGRFDSTLEVPHEARAPLIDSIAALPARLRAAVEDLTEEQLATPYREGGWTIRQLVHHLPDSHLNSYIRFRWALTEQDPAIKVYDQAAWAELPDARTAPIDLSLDLLDALHRRWIVLLRAMAPGDYGRTFRHPEIGQVSLALMLRLYEWHGRHHLAHITGLRERMGWTMPVMAT